MRVSAFDAITFAGAALFALVLTADAVGEEITLPVRDVYDGDTIRATLDLPGLPEELRKVSVRLAGIDTPERGWRAQCPAEAELAESARAYVVGRLAGAEAVTVLDPDWGKFGGRIIGRVMIDGSDLASELIERGFAIAYDGGKKVNPWCEGAS